MLDENIQEIVEIIREHLPSYLTEPQQQKLIDCIRTDFPRSTDPNKVYSKLEDLSLFYQGDILNDFPFSLYDTGSSSFKTIYINGMIASNTCDIFPENERNLNPFSVQIISIYDFETVLEKFRAQKISEDKITNFVKEVRGNTISNLFYLPEKKNGDDIILKESFARFDYSVSLPLPLLNSEKICKDYIPNGDRVVSLSNYGFYLFLMKLSIHYCRIREGVFRAN